MHGVDIGIEKTDTGTIFFNIKKENLTAHMELFENHICYLFMYQNKNLCHHEETNIIDAWNQIEEFLK